MNIYEISQAVKQVIENGFYEDPETGEILFDGENVVKLDEAIETKIDNIACYVKNQLAYAGAIKAEEKALAKRRKQAEKKVEYLEKLITYLMDLAGKTKLPTARNVISFRASTKLEIEDEDAFAVENINNENIVKQETTFTIDKAEVKRLLKEKVELKGAKLVENRNLQIK